MSDRVKMLQAEFSRIQALNLKLDMTRGKPATEQLNLSNGLLNVLEPGDFFADDGTDCRNYGGVDGIPECKRLFADYLDVGVNEIIIGGNSSLALMHDALMRAVLFGVYGGERPWGGQRVKFICPVPGYDRHFALCELLGIDMINVPLNESGPDMSVVECLVAEDPAIKGIWCVPRYSNPNGAVYSDEVINSLAKMKTAAPDFRIFYDNAYAVHGLYDEEVRQLNILAACKKSGNPHRVLIFGSTSKISLAGAGIAVMAGSQENIDHARKYLSLQTIGPDKINQLRHVRFFGSYEGILRHMKKHAEIVRPKFEIVGEVLDRMLGQLNVASWSRPRGGYFISLDVAPNTAKKTVSLAGELGVKFTPAGATFPYGKDPDDSNIRIAPTMPKSADIAQAIEALAVCVQLASLAR